MVYLSSISAWEPLVRFGFARCIGGHATSFLLAGALSCRRLDTRKP